MEVDTYTHDNVIVTDDVVMIERIVDYRLGKRVYHRTSQFLVSDGVQEVDVSYIPLERLQEILNI